jgi:monoamine oxidase
MIDVIVAGAGAAGLAAGYRLARAGLKVAVLEARKFPGGRILTVADGDRAAPLELGAEFVHGTKNAVCDLAGEAGWRAKPAVARQWIFEGGHFRPGDSLYDNLSALFQRVDRGAPDRPFDDFLRGQATPDAWFARMFVEGFAAADTSHVSAQALARAELSDEGGQDKDFRLKGGYVNLVDYLRAGFEAAGGVLYCGALIQGIDWREGRVQIVAQTARGRSIFPASQAVLALPLSILQAPPGEVGAIRFTPELRQKQPALAGLEMGAIVKINLRFADFFWKSEIGAEEFGFVHTPGGAFRTWWSRSDAPILTGWVGGPAAAALNRNAMLDLALREVHQLFGRAPLELRRRLEDWRVHDWSADPLARGAYSYTRVGGLKAAEQLAEPIAQTLFFAGEALASGPAQGTVHGAVATGFRAADRVLEAVCHGQRGA